MWLVICLLLAAMSCAPAAAASLRTMVTLSGPNVRLSDLFADAGPDAARVLGPAPAPGGRITVKAAQLAAIALQFDVDWQPAGAGDQVILERPGRPLPRAAIVAVLRPALASAGAPADAELQLPGYSPLIVGLHEADKLTVEQLDYNPGSGRFTALLGLPGNGDALREMRVAGRAVAMAMLPVPTHRLARGTIIEAADLRMTRVAATSVANDMAQTMADAIGLSVRTQLAPGQPMPLSDLVQPMLVRRDDPVAVLLDQPGLSVTAQARALQDGSLGSRIRVLNPLSHAVLDAEVTGPDQVRVRPGSMPLRPATAMRRIASR